MNKIISISLLLFSSSFFCFADDHKGKYHDHDDDEEEYEEYEDFLDIMQQYIEIGNEWIETLETKEGTAFFAIESVCEIHEENGNMLDAIPTLEKYAKNEKLSMVIRRIAMFKVVEIYREEGKKDKALEAVNKIMANL